MSAPAIERIKYRARVAAGACLHAAGLYRRLLPVFQPRPPEPLRRLQAYLQHYYDQAESAEAELYLAGLGLTVACDIKDHMLWPHLEGKAPVYEQLDIDHCRAAVRPGDHILDVGANHGFWGFALAQAAGADAVAYFCEPNPKLQRRVRRTAQLNPGIAARLLPYAIADGTQDALTFYLPTGNLSGLGSTVLHQMARDNGYLTEQLRMTVPSRSIDALVQEGAIARIDVMKIDVEHAEDAVVRGADAALRRFRPRLVMVETSPDSAAARTFEAMGYASYRLAPDGARAAVEPGYWGNIFFHRSAP
ncbi:FkbM family methyltransferase [Ramlibacter sp.]|uniref:FkbM family methyltransferase n=1 Tax=Ramlibacter sp. TaxID=1917967 RepID=UPI00178FA924|nr:FkbM family methyltransferase [Ramlibacter sp.]MBA2672855.1 FkbM family methyltransferase [Ramlibacter sp.]